MQYLILLAVVSMMLLYVLTIAGCLCYVGRHGCVLNTPLVLNESRRFAHVNG
jgi:hypothetical protein